MSIVDTALTPLRRLARAMGDTGGMILMLAAMSISSGMISVTGSRLLNLSCLMVMGATLLSIAARRADGNGHRAMRLMIERAGAPDQETERLARWLGVPIDADERTIRRAATARIKAGHADAGGRGGDMDTIVTVRNRLVERIGTRRPLPSGARILQEWRNHAGALGQAWGALLPSPRLEILREATGQSLWPSSRTTASGPMRTNQG